MDNNVIVPVNLMRACALYNVAHENNVLLLMSMLLLELCLHSIENKNKNRMKYFIIVATYYR